MSESRPDWYGLPTKAAWSTAESAVDEYDELSGADWSMEGMAQTVTGPLEPGLLGAVMMQEHLLVDLSGVNVPQSVAGPTGEHFWKLPCESLEVSGILRFYSLMNEEDSAMLDIDEAIEGVMLYKQHGGGTLVSPTGNEIGRDPHGLRRISLATGVPIVMGTAHYVGAAQDGESMDVVDVETIAAEFISDIQEGVVVHQGNPMHRDGGWGVPSGIRAGIIGEIGCSHPLQDGEKKTLHAAALAQRATGAAIQVHPGRDATSPITILRELESAGADMARVVMCHMDRTVFTKDGALEIARTGCFMEYDLFGNYVTGFYPHNPEVDLPNDAGRIAWIRWLIAEGYGERLLVAQDICFRHRLTKYGGHGYHYILAEIVPRMLTRGLTKRDVHRLLVDNPKAVLTFARPQKLLSPQQDIKHGKGPKRIASLPAPKL